jgi:hypothetical protein
MVVVVVVLVVEKCSSWSTNKLTAMPSALSMVAAAAAWAHVTAAAGRAQRVAAITRGRLLLSLPALLSEMPLPVVTKLSPLLSRMCEVGPLLPIVLALRPCAPMTLLSGPQLTASPLAPKLMPPTMLKSPVLMSSPQTALGPVPDGRAAKVMTSVLPSLGRSPAERPTPPATGMPIGMPPRTSPMLPSARRTTSTSLAPRLTYTAVPCALLSPSALRGAIAITVGHE